MDLGGRVAKMQEELDLPEEIVRDLLSVAGADIVVVADDSGSMSMVSNYQTYPLRRPRPPRRRDEGSRERSAGRGDAATGVPAPASEAAAMARGIAREVSAATPRPRTGSAATCGDE